MADHSRIALSDNRVPRIGLNEKWCGDPSFGEAFARSLEEGHSVSFRVDVDPDGDATITPVSQPTAKHEVFPVEEAGEVSSELQRALAAARERGRIRAAEVLVGEDMMSAEAFAKLLGTTRVTVNVKRVGVAEDRGPTPSSGS